MIFIAMLVFQLAGALILLLKCCIGSKKAVIRSCFPGPILLLEIITMSALFQKTNCGKVHIKYISMRRLFWIW